MKNFSQTDIEQVADIFLKFNDAKAQALIDQFSKEQGAVLAYLVASGEMFETPAESEITLLLGVVVWQLYKKHNPKLQSLSPQTVEKIEVDVFRELEAINDIADDTQFEAAINQWQDKHAQPILFAYIQAELNESFDESYGTALSIMSVVINSFEQVA